MKDIKYNFDTPTYKWAVYRCRSFSVEIQGWQRDQKFGWNVYAYIFEEHPYFKDVRKALDLHFHGGPTLEQLIHESPAQGIRYSFQSEHSYLKIGSDYQHLYDDWFETQDPVFGIPAEVRSDAKQLVLELLEAVT